MNNVVLQAFLSKLSLLFWPILKAALVFLIGWFVIKKVMKLVERGLKKSKIEVTLHAFVLSLTRITLIVLLAISCATMSQLVDATSVVTALGAAGLAVSLAVKDGLANLAGGLSLLAAKPFAVGDYIATDSGKEGTVAKIDLAHTVLRTVDNKQIFIPNGKMSSAIITNYTNEPLRRLDQEWSIGYQDDFARAEAVVSQIIADHPSILKDPAPMVRVTRHGDNAIVLVSRVWVMSENYWNVNFDMLEQVKKRFDEEGINIPYPQMDVHLHS